MSDSILTSIKKNLGLAEDYTVFDSDIILYINGVFSTLNQLGIGPDLGFAIEDASAVWDDFLVGDLRKNSVKSYMTLKVRMLFDPPQVSYLVTALEKQAEELEWRLNAYREHTEWVHPDPLADEEDLVLDGGLP